MDAGSQIKQREVGLMADYKRYRTETLKKMRSAAWEKYRTETEKSAGGWGDGMRLSKLPQLRAWERARERYEAIEEELKRRRRDGSAQRH